jgi:hypothetical protein
VRFQGLAFDSIAETSDAMVRHKASQGKGARSLANAPGPRSFAYARPKGSRVRPRMRSRLSLWRHRNRLRETGQPNSRPLGVIIRRNSSGGRPVTRTITPSGVLTSAIRAHQLALPIPSIAVPRLALVLGLSLAVLSEGAADIHYLVKPTLFVPAHIPLVSPGIDQLALACCHGCDLQLSIFEI